jgi:hypothetical protein
VGTGLQLAGDQRCAQERAEQRRRDREDDDAGGVEPAVGVGQLVEDVAGQTGSTIAAAATPTAAAAAWMRS